MKKLFLFFFALVVSIGSAWADKTIYLEPSKWDKPDETEFFAAYAWGGSQDAGWYDPEVVEGATYLKFTIPDDRTGLLFTRALSEGDKHSWGDKWNQTEDVDISGVTDNAAYIFTSWGDANNKSTVTSTTFSPYTVKFVTGLNWTNLYAYTYGEETIGEWPGKKMTETNEKCGNTSIYSISFLSTAAPGNIIFNDGTISGSVVGTNKTADLTFTNGKLYTLPNLPDNPTIAEKRVLTITGYYGEKSGAYAADDMDKTTVLSGRNVYHAETPSAAARIEGIGIGGLATKQMEKLHLAVWAKESVENAKIQVYSGGWQSATKNLTGGQWNVFDIALDEFSSPLVDAYALKVVNESGAALGTEIYITDVFFYNEGTKPMLTASIVSHTGTSVDLKMSSYKSASATTDAMSYTIAWTGDGNKVVNKANGDEFTETIDGLTQGNTYTFSITAKDDNNVVSEAKELTVALTVPPTSVPYPSQDNSNVISVYSQKFGDITGLAFGGDWTNTEEVIDGSKTRKIEKLVYGNFSFATKDVSTMVKLHFDVYPMENMPQIGLRLQGPSIDSKKGHKEVLAAGTWNSFDIDISEFELTDEQLQNINNIQIVSDINGSGGNINGNGTGIFYIGNVYFWKDLPDTEKPVMVSATKGEIEGTTAKVTLNATDNSGHVKYVLTEKDAKVAAITTELQTAGTDYEYTISGLSQNTEYTFTITAQDAAGNESENNKEVNFTTSNVIGTSGTGVTGTNGGGTPGLEYSYNIEQNGTDINVTFTCTNDGDYTGLVSWIWDNTDGFKEIGSGYATITKTLNYAAGTTIKVACKWAYAGGMSVTDYIEYTVADVAPTPTEGYYIIGSMNEWSINNNYKLTLNETAAPTVEYYFPSLALTTTSQFKVVYSADGTDKTTYYPEGMGNAYGENGEIASDGNYTIFFRPNGDGGDDWFYNVIYVTSMIDAGVDPTTGAHILTGVWDAAKFASIDAMDKANSYDLTGVDFTGVAKPINMVGKTANPYCMFITSISNTVNRNEVVWDATNNRYNGYAMEFKETAGSTAPFDINTNISPIFVNNPLFHRLNSAAGRYVTLTIPYDYNLKEGHKAYTMSSTSSASGVTITFTEIAAGSKLTKNTPYLYYTPSDEIYLPTPGEVTIDWAAETVNQTDASFVANYRNITADGTENIYVLPGIVEESGIKFYKAGNSATGEKATIRPFRAYITVPAASPARINVVFNDATGIHAATTEQLEGIFNIYSIDGKLVRQNTESKVGLEKGIYIINGKKVVIK